MLFVLALLFPLVQAADEVVIIEAVSQSKQRFAIPRGLAEGVVQGQKSLFTNDNASFYATATEVNRTHSLWDISDKRGRVPFEKGDFVSFTNSPQAIWVEPPKIQFDTDELGKLPPRQWSVRGHASLALRNSTAKVDTTRQKTRYGFQLDVLYNMHLRYNMEVGTGLRFDREISQLDNPRVDSIVYRGMLIGELTYHLERAKETRGNYYVGVGIGYGPSSTTVDETVQSGNSLALPIVRIGYRHPTSSGQALLFELSAESIASQEAFQGQPAQSMSVLNSKGAIGFRF